MASIRLHLLQSQAAQGENVCHQPPFVNAPLIQTPPGGAKPYRDAKDDEQLAGLALRTGSNGLGSCLDCPRPASPAHWPNAITLSASATQFGRVLTVVLFSTVTFPALLAALPQSQSLQAVAAAAAAGVLPLIPGAGATQEVGSRHRAVLANA